jgi:hypothetical protein
MRTHGNYDAYRFQLKLLDYANSYYIDRLAHLESELARQPRYLHIEMIGAGEIPADSALLIRSVLMNRSPETEVITHARSSLQGASVLVWLSGDKRVIRDDARIFFRRANVDEQGNDDDEEWKDSELSFSDESEIDLDETDYAAVLQVINEYLPVKEMAGKVIRVPELRQFGLVDNDKVDDFLATVFAHEKEPPGSVANTFRMVAQQKLPTRVTERHNKG